MKLKVTIDPATESNYSQIVANIPQVEIGLFEIKYNFAQDFGPRIDAEEFDDQYALLDSILLELNSLFSGINIK